MAERWLGSEASQASAEQVRLRTAPRSGRHWWARASIHAGVVALGLSDEYAGPLPGAERPAFSYLALGSLRGWADNDGDGTVTAQEVRDYSQYVLQYFLAGERSQQPMLAGSPTDLALAAAGEPGPDLRQLHKQYRLGPAGSEQGIRCARNG